MTYEEVVALFRAYGLVATYYYAGTREYEKARGAWAQGQAESLFDQHPELEAQLREVSKDFTWSLEESRPTNKGGST